MPFLRQVVFQKSKNFGIVSERENEKTLNYCNRKSSKNSLQH